MRLYEAKRILKKAGYIVRSLNEDTDTDAETHMSLMDKIKHAKEYNASTWERMPAKEKTAAIGKLLSNGYKFMDENPLNPDGCAIIDDIYEEIPELADAWDEAVDELEYIYFSGDGESMAEWDDWVNSYGTGIIRDIIAGMKVAQIVKKYRKELN